MNTHIHKPVLKSFLSNYLNNFCGQAIRLGFIVNDISLTTPARVSLAPFPSQARALMAVLGMSIVQGMDWL